MPDDGDETMSPSWTPAWFNLPEKAFTPVEDVDEEIFLLYTRKLQTPSEPRPGNRGRQGAGLGYIDAKHELVTIAVTIQDTGPSLESNATKSKRGTALAGQAQEKTFEVELQQDLTILKNSKGDTGSVVWRLSIDLAQYLLTCAYFPESFPASNPPLLRSLQSLSIIELGSGTGFLGSLFMSLGSASASPKGTSLKNRKEMASKASPARPKRWVLTDLPTNLPLVLRNLTRCGLFSEPESGDRIEVRELDWLDPASYPVRALFRGDSASAPTALRPDDNELQEAALLLAVDCIYNPALARGLATTLSSLARTESSKSSNGHAEKSAPAKPVLALIVSELREQEALEVFLRELMTASRDDARWHVVRVGFDENMWRDGIGRNDAVVWAAWWCP